MDKLKKVSARTGANPVSFFNLTFADIADDFPLIGKGHKDHEIDDELNLYYCLPTRKRIGRWDAAARAFYIDTRSESPLAINSYYTPFELLTAFRFGGDYRRAQQHIEFKLLNPDIPYIRVGINYFKVIKKRSRYGIELTELKPWNKDSIKQDHGEAYLKRVHLFDDFTIEPNNKQHEQIVEDKYNLYEPFPHQAAKKTRVTLDDIPTTAAFMSHIFGEQTDLGYKYMKVLYEYPKQHLPVLTLVSTERQTGKTTFLNWLDMIFGNNYVMISPDDLSNQFNSTYAYKNVIGIDEAVVDKQSAVEKIKSIATANTMTVNQKNIAQYRIPFFGKLIITTNKERDFMRVDEEEIRFWVRKILPIPPERLNAQITQRMLAEIPLFLRYLELLPDIDFTRSRMVFTADELANESLALVKHESHSGLRKELDILISDYFLQHSTLESFHATATDIKREWFEHDSKISRAYIRKVIRDEMRLDTLDLMRYNAFGNAEASSKVGTPYLFTREAFCPQKAEKPQSDDPFGANYMEDNGFPF